MANGLASWRTIAMDYRLYVFNSLGKFADVEEWSCASDEVALEHASRQRHAYGAELWQGRRRLSTMAGPMSLPGDEHAA